jgi:hypothetical protein
MSFVWISIGALLVLGAGLAPAKEKPDLSPAFDDPAKQKEQTGSGPAFRADQIVQSWEDVLAMARGVYLTRAEKVPRAEPGGHHDWCFEHVRTELLKGESKLSERLCAPSWETLGGIHEGPGCGDRPSSAWIVTIDEGGKQVLFAVEGACGAPEELSGLDVYRSEFVGDVRCGQIDRVWSAIPAADQACRKDADCTVLSAAGNCFNQPMAVAAAAPYREVLEQHGPGCMYAIMGMCPERKIIPICREGVCGIKDGAFP